MLCKLWISLYFWKFLKLLNLQVQYYLMVARVETKDSSPESRSCSGVWLSPLAALPDNIDWLKTPTLLPFYSRSTRVFCGRQRKFERKLLVEIHCFRSWKKLWYMSFIPAWPVIFNQHNQILWFYWFNLGYLHQYFCKLCCRNLNNLLKRKYTLIWKKRFSSLHH